MSTHVGGRDERRTESFSRRPPTARTNIKVEVIMFPGDAYEFVVISVRKFELQSETDTRNSGPRQKQKIDNAAGKKVNKQSSNATRQYRFTLHNVCFLLIARSSLEAAKKHGFEFCRQRLDASEYYLTTLCGRSTVQVGNLFHSWY